MEVITETTSLVKFFTGFWLALFKLPDGDDWKTELGAATCTPLIGCVVFFKLQKNNVKQY